jgi:hypothetical protein
MLSPVVNPAANTAGTKHDIYYASNDCIINHNQVNKRFTLNRK